MKITITLTETDALMLVKLLATEPKAVAIVKDIQSALSKDKSALRNKQLMS
jgi:hypothetical protein